MQPFHEAIALQVVKLEGFMLKSATGMTVFMNWVLLAVIDSFINRNQARLFRVIREASWKAFVMHVISVLPQLDVRYSARKPTSHSEDQK